MVGLSSDRSGDGFYNAVGNPCNCIAYQLSRRDLEEFEKYKCSVFFPSMNSTKVLYNDEGESVIKFGEVILPWRDLSSGHNLENYFYSGRFNLLDFFMIIKCSSPI